MGLLLGLGGCPMDRAAPPDAICSDAQMIEVLRDLSAHFSRGFSEAEVRSVEAEVSRWRGRELRTFEFRDVVFQGHASAEFSFYLQRQLDGRLGIGVYVFGDRLLGAHVEAAIKVLAARRCGGA